MPTDDKFIQTMLDSYHFEGESIILGSAKKGETIFKNTFIRLPLVTFNRHGMISGATGTGKTKTLQILAEQLSGFGVPSLVMDIKGDLSGIAESGMIDSRIKERHDKIGLQFNPQSSPVEMLTLSGQKGVKLRATLTEFGPILFSKILSLNDVQSGIVSVIFKYCDDLAIPLIDLKDFKKVIQYLTNDGKEEFEGLYGNISVVSMGTILRKIVELEQQNADIFFGEPSFEVDDLVRMDENGKGIVSILRLTDIQDKPKLFSTFMLQLLAEIYTKFPEEGDLDRPKLVFFIDEAHLIFEEASKALLDQIEVIIKLIRSKGVGVFFVTQIPGDIPDAVLSQLGMKIQHSLRAFTAKDRKEIQKVSENFPISEFYDVSELLTNLGIGEAVVTALNEKGIPTQLVQTYLRAPASRMNVLTDQEIDDLTSSSSLIGKYNRDIERESAFEILSQKIEKATIYPEEKEKKVDSKPSETFRKGKSTLETIISNPMVRQIGRSVAREVSRSILGILGFGKKR